MTILSSKSINPTTATSWEAYWQYYEASDYVNYTPQVLELLRPHLNLRSAHILEVGAGTGGNASTLAALGAKVTTLDFAPAALARTMTTARNRGVTLDVIQADGRALPFTSSAFDLVYHLGFLEHFTDPETFVSEQHRVLRQDGYLLVDVPQRYNWYTIYKHRLIRSGCWPYGGWEREFSFKELSDLLIKGGFRIVDAYGRGYYPRSFSMLRNADKLETKLLKKSHPSKLLRYYNTLWTTYEKSWLGFNTLQCVGILAVKK